MFESYKQIAKTIFIVEDNQMYAKTLKTYIQNCFINLKEIKIFSIGEMCLLELHRNPAVIIMDYFLNSKYEAADNGLAIIKRIKMLDPKANIVVLSTMKPEYSILKEIKEWNCSYVQKDKDAFKKVEQIINTIFNGENNLEREMLN